MTPNRAVIGDGLTDTEIPCETVLNISNQRLYRERHVQSMWILGPFICDREMSVVRINRQFSSAQTISISTGAPQDSVMSPVLFTLCTDNCRGSDPEIIYIKFSDRVIVDTINCEGQLQAEMNTSLEQYKGNCFDLNTSSTKELVIDFCHEQHTIPRVNSQNIERVEAYKYL